MTPLLVTVPLDRKTLLELLQPEIERLIARAETKAAAEARKQYREAAKLRRSVSPALQLAIDNVARASARVDVAHNTRDERPSLNALVAAASGLRRAHEASRKGN